MIKRISYSMLIGSVVMFGLSGCTSKNAEVANLEKELAKKNEEISQKEKTIEALEKSDTNKGEVQIANLSSIEKQYPLLPVDAKAGECYARVLIPAQYKWGEERILKKSASEQYNIIPAVYKYVPKTVQVADETYKYITIPATYKFVKDKVLVEPVKHKIINVPTKYKKVVERRLIKHAYETWKQGSGPYEKIDNHTGEIVCKIKVPAQYEEIEKTVVDTAAHTKTIEIPAKYKYIDRKVIDQPAKSEKVIIPAQFKEIQVKELVSDAKQIKLDTPEEYQTVKSKKLVVGEHMKWQQILCETNTTPDVIKRLQNILKDKNFYHKEIDGIYGSSTRSAVHNYQKSNNLASGALTLETLKSLNLI